MFQVRPKPDSHEESVEVLSHMLKSEFNGQSGIIYALSIKDVESLAKDLRAKDIRVAPYHAQLTAQLRSVKKC